MNVVVIDNGKMNPAFYPEFFSQIKKHNGCDKIIIIADGDFTQTGVFSPYSFSYRKKELEASGADMIIKLPVYCTCMRSLIYNFALTNLINKSTCMDRLILPVAEDTLESSEFAKAFASDLKFSYSRTVSEEMAVPDGILLDNSKILESNRISGNKKEAGILDLFKDFIKSASYNDMLEIFGGTPSIIDRIIQKKDDVLSSSSLIGLSEELACGSVNAETFRYYVLRTSMHFRKLDNSICALYEYSCYAQVEYEKEAAGLSDCIESAGFIHVYKPDLPETLFKMNESKQRLVKIDAFVNLDDCDC